MAVSQAPGRPRQCAATSRPLALSHGMNKGWSGVFV